MELGESKTSPPSEMAEMESTKSMNSTVNDASMKDPCEISESD